MSANTISLDDLRLLADMDNRIGDAGGPTLAFQLIMQKQALQDRIGFLNWLEKSKTLAHVEDEQQSKIAAAQQLGRRAELRLGSM